MWMNRKLRRDCLGDPSKLGMEVLKRIAKRETPRPGQEWLSLSTWRRQPGWLWREFARDPGHFAPCPFPHGAFGCVDSGEGLGGGGREGGKNEPFPSGGATLPLGAACRRFKLQCRFCRSSAWIGFCAQRLARIVGPRCLIQKSSKNHLGLRRHVLDTKFGSRHDVTKPLVFR